MQENPTNRLLHQPSFNCEQVQGNEMIYETGNMNFFQRRRFLKKANLLDLTPTRLHEHETDEGGKVVLMVKKFRRGKVSRYMLGRRSPYYRVKLDELGSAVWKAIDGSSKVSDILDRIRAVYTETPEKTEELESRLSKYLSLLYDNRYIYFRELEVTKK